MPEFLIIKKCKGSEIFVEGVKRITLIENSIDITFVGISRILNVFNVINSKMQIFTHFRPNLLGEIKGLELGPYNANFENLPSVLEEIGITPC